MYRRLLLCSVALVLVAGCGGEPMHDISGKVVFTDGSPVTAGMLILSSEDGRGAKSRIGIDGSFEITSAQLGDGAPAGTYAVGIIEPDGLTMSDEVRARASTWAVAAKFQTPSKSGLTITVGPGEATTDLVLEVEKRDIAGQDVSQGFDSIVEEVERK